MATVRLIGPGRAGMSVASALAAAGHDIAGFVTSHDDPAEAASGVDVLIIAVPDRRIADVARQVRPVDSTVVLHLSGSQGLEVLAPHARRGSMHPLVPMPTPDVGAARIEAGVTFAVAGDPVATELAMSLGGRTVVVRDEDRAAYHAAACIAANHVVALMGQVARVAESIGLDLDVFLGLSRPRSQTSRGSVPRRLSRVRRRGGTRRRSQGTARLSPPRNGPATTRASHWRSASSKKATAPAFRSRWHIRSRWRSP